MFSLWEEAWLDDEPETVLSARAATIQTVPTQSVEPASDAHETIQTQPPHPSAHDATMLKWIAVLLLVLILQVDALRREISTLKRVVPRS